MSQTSFGSDYLPTVSSIMVEYLMNVRQFTPLLIILFSLLG